jgi:hypothetical protein
VKYLAVFISSLLIGCTANRPHEIPEPVVIDSLIKHSNSYTGPESIIRNDALSSYNEGYIKASKNKAFAQSLSGAWGWRSNRTSAQHAKTSALIVCEKNNIRYQSLYPCKIVNLNGNWMN